MNNNVPFAAVTPRTSFYPGVNGAGRYGKCFKLSIPILVSRGSPALPFMATAVSEQGIPIDFQEDEMVSFSPPPPSLPVEIETDEKAPAPEANRKEILITGYFLAEKGARKGQQIVAYALTTGHFTF